MNQSNNSVPIEDNRHTGEGDVKAIRKYTVLVLMTANSAWLKLSRAQRDDFNKGVVAPIFAKYVNQVDIHMFDAEAFYARSSDFALFSTDDLQHYYFLMEELRDTALFNEPYFSINDIIVGLENGYQEFEAKQNEYAN